MNDVTLALSDALELAELLQFLSDGTSREDDRLTCSFADYVGHPAYGIPQLGDDLDRFIFLLGGDDEGKFMTGSTS